MITLVPIRLNLATQICSYDEYIRNQSVPTNSDRTVYATILADL